MLQKAYNLEFLGYWRETETIPSLSGIYGIYWKMGGQVHLMYIGQSNNVKGRVEEHIEQPKWQNVLRKGGELRFNVALIPPNRDLNRIEAAMIYEHKPRYNTNYKNNFPFETTMINTSGKHACMKGCFTG